MKSSNNASLNLNHDEQIKNTSGSLNIIRHLVQPDRERLHCNMKTEYTTDRWSQGSDLVNPQSIKLNLQKAMIINPSLFKRNSIQSQKVDTWVNVD